MNPYAVRRYIIGGIIIAVFLVYLIRLFYIQVIDSSYKYSSENNSQRYVTQYPARGLVYDRNGVLLVCNEAAYDLMVSPMELKAFDTSEFCNILKVDKNQVIRGIQKARNYSRYKSSPFLYQVSDTTYAHLQEKLYKFPGFFVQPRTLRQYNKQIASHVMGYVGEVDSSHIKKDAYYQIGDYIGMSGVEKNYEKELRGKKGVNIYIVDVHNQIKGSFQNGKYDTAVIVGKNITTTLDADIQAYGEKLMKRFRGSIVAIEPSTGEILALVSSPYYNPSLLVGRVRSRNYNNLRIDPKLPLFNRALMAKYPPGSTFKAINGLVGLHEKVFESSTRFSCNYGFHFGPIDISCHSHASPLDLPLSLQTSCNAYFCNVFKRVMEDTKYNSQRDAYINWRKLVMSFGFGKKLGSDFPNELSGNVPSPEYFDKYYGRNGWKSLTVISLAIGQGELGITPLQMANMTAAIGNRGYYYTPHIVKKIEGIDSINSSFTIRNNTLFDTSLFRPIIQGMEMAVNGPGGGTARIAQLPNIIICGKTGTAQNPHGEDHSIFIAFAPKDNPKIAISVYVENAGYGASWAAPIASLIIEKYLTDSISRPYLETYLLNAELKYEKKP